MKIYKRQIKKFTIKLKQTGESEHLKQGMQEKVDKVLEMISGLGRENV
jgi:hypothetical protein